MTSIKDENILDIDHGIGWVISVITTVVSREQFSLALEDSTRYFFY